MCLFVVVSKPSLLALKKMSGYCRQVQARIPDGVLGVASTSRVQLPLPSPGPSHMSSPIPRTGTLDTTSTSSIIFIDGDIGQHRPIDGSKCHPDEKTPIAQHRPIDGSKRHRQETTPRPTKAKIPKKVNMVTSTPLQDEETDEFLTAVENIKDSLARVVHTEKELYQSRHEEYLQSFGSGVREGMKSCANLFGTERRRLQSRIGSLRDLNTHITSMIQVSIEELHHAAEWEEQFQEFANKIENFSFCKYFSFYTFLLSFVGRFVQSWFHTLVCHLYCILSFVFCTYFVESTLSYPFFPSLCLFLFALYNYIHMIILFCPDLPYNTIFSGLTLYTYIHLYNFCSTFRLIQYYFLCVNPV